MDSKVVTEAARIEASRRRTDLPSSSDPQRRRGAIDAITARVRRANRAWKQSAGLRRRKVQNAEE